MIRVLETEYLKKSRVFLANQTDIYQREIDSITGIIKEYKNLKSKLYDFNDDPDDLRKELNEWRRISWHLHRRRAELKATREKLFSQIREVEMYMPYPEFSSSYNAPNSRESLWAGSR